LVSEAYQHCGEAPSWDAPTKTAFAGNGPVYFCSSMLAYCKFR